jgi:hypothetical protein
MSSFVLAPLPAATSYTVAIPDLAMLSGTVDDPGGVVLAGSGSVNCFDLSGPGRDFMIGFLQPGNRSFRSFLERGHSCSIFASYPVRFPGSVPDAGSPTTPPQIFDPAIPEPPTTFNGDLARNFTAPPTLAEPVEVVVRVIDVRGQPLTGYFVTASTEPNTGPLAGKRLTAGAPFTDDTGSASFLVVPGTYDILVERLLAP